MQPFVPLSPTGTVAYDELGTSGVSRVRIAKILRFGAPLFFANVAMLKVCAAYTLPPLPHPLAPVPGSSLLHFFHMRRSHSISFTRAQGIPKYKIGLGGGKDGRVGERLVHCPAYGA